jgi:hypothetical protein
MSNTIYTEWRAEVQSAYPNAKIQMSAGDHLSEFAFLPDTKANVGWYNHDLERGSVAVTAAPKDAGTYTYFKLRNSKLTINRRGKNEVFRQGDPLGWRLSNSGKFIRLISPITGPNVIFSLELTDEVLKWLDKQDPKAKHKVGQRKSDKPEDGANVLEGYVVTNGKWFYKVSPTPTRTLTIKPKVIYKNKGEADRVARQFRDRNLTVKEVWTKDLGGAKV